MDVLHQQEGTVGKKQWLYLRQYAAFIKKQMWNFNNANNTLPICPSERLTTILVGINFKCLALCKSFYH